MKCFCLLSLLLMISASRTVMGAPPLEGELQQYREDGSIAQRQDFQRSLENDKYSPELLQRAKAKLTHMSLLAKGVPASDVTRIAPLPPPAWRGMRTTGLNHVLTLLVEFRDHRFTAINTRDSIHSSVFEDGRSEN